MGPVTWNILFPMNLHAKSCAWHCTWPPRLTEHLNLATGLKLHSCLDLYPQLFYQPRWEYTITSFSCFVLFVFSFCYEKWLDIKLTNKLCIPKQGTAFKSLSKRNLLPTKWLTFFIIVSHIMVAVFIWNLCFKIKFVLLNYCTLY